MVNSIPVSSNPRTVPLKPTATPQFGNASKLKASAKVDAFQKSSNVRFENNNNDGVFDSVKKTLRKTTAATLGIASCVGLAVGVPLGLMQMVPGIAFHPLLVTGALTMGIPLAGLLGAIWLWGDKKK